MKPSTKRISLRIWNVISVIPVHRYVDKLVDELAKGKKMEKILRQEEPKP